MTPEINPCDMQDRIDQYVAMIQEKKTCTLNVPVLRFLTHLQ